MKTIQVRGKEYSLLSITGQVVGASKNLETTVFRGGGGGYTQQGTGYSSPVNISSVTTVRDQFFLIDKDGKEHAFQLSNVNVACREGHKLTVVWVIKGTEGRGPYVAVRNHTTGDTFYVEKAIRDICKPPKRETYLMYFLFLFQMILLAAVLWKVISGDLLGGGIAAMLFVIIFIVNTRLGFAKSNKRTIPYFKSEIDFDQL